MNVGGDIIEVTYNHPTIGIGTLSCKSGEEATIDFGGYTKADDAGMIAGDGRDIQTMTRKRWSFESPIVWDMTDRNELDILQKLQNNPLAADWSFSHIGGAVWGATGHPVGDIQGAAQTTLISLKVSGGGVLAKI